VVALFSGLDLIILMNDLIKNERWFDTWGQFYVFIAMVSNQKKRNYYHLRY
jgi:hypothetical protein